MTWSRVWLWIPPILWMALIFHYSSESRPVPILTENVWDKALHLGGYMVLGALFYRAFRGEGLGAVAATILAITATSLYGASDEWHQSFVPFRNSDGMDWVVDTLGGGLGAALYARLMPRARIG